MPPLLVVNADDLGVTRGANLGIASAHAEGVVTSASLAPTYEAYEHAVEQVVLRHPNLGIGLHFTLTSGRPVSDPARVPLLIDERGYFRWRFLPLLVAVRNNTRLLDQIAFELNSQLDRLAADGISPDHINGERHVQLIPGVFEHVVEAATSRGIPFVRCGTECGFRYARLAHAPVLVGGGAVKSALLGTLSAIGRPLLRPPVASAARFASYLYTGRPDLFLSRLLAEDPVPGVTEVMVHPGVPSQSRGASLGNDALMEYVTSEWRTRELDACIAARAVPTRWLLSTFRNAAATRVAS